MTSAASSGVGQFDAGGWAASPEEILDNQVWEAPPGETRKWRLIRSSWGREETL